MSHVAVCGRMCVYVCLGRVGVVSCVSPGSCGEQFDQWNRSARTWWLQRNDRVLLRVRAHGADDVAVMRSFDTTFSHHNPSLDL